MGTKGGRWEDERKCVHLTMTFGYATRPYFAHSWTLHTTMDVKAEVVSAEVSAGRFSSLYDSHQRGTANLAAFSAGHSCHPCDIVVRHKENLEQPRLR